jgi:hypothetical protein
MRDAQGREGVSPVDRTYDIFEIDPDGYPIWKTAVIGQEAAIRKLHDISEQTPNELRMMHVATQTVVATVNPPKS